MLHCYYNCLFKRIPASQQGQVLGVTVQFQVGKLLFPEMFLTLEQNSDKHEEPFTSHLIKKKKRKKHPNNWLLESQKMSTLSI